LLALLIEIPRTPHGPVWSESRKWTSETAFQKKKKKKWLLPPEMKFIKPLSTQELCVHMAPRVLEGIKVETNLYLGVSG
jgi:hypothetical protein